MGDKKKCESTAMCYLYCTNTLFISLNNNISQLFSFKPYRKISWLRLNKGLFSGIFISDWINESLSQKTSNQAQINMNFQSGSV